VKPVEALVVAGVDDHRERSRRNHADDAAEQLRRADATG
jgi:hypothetical protein